MQLRGGDEGLELVGIARVVGEFLDILDDLVLQERLLDPASTQSSPLLVVPMNDIEVEAP